MERELNLSEVSDGKRYGLHDLVKVGCEDCAGCSSCCQGMEDTIVLDPYDCWRLTGGLGKSFEELLDEAFTLGMVDGLALPKLKLAGENGRCVFLNEQGRCSIHAYRPGICRLFPLGRIYEENSCWYFLQIHECPKKNKTKVKVQKWLDTPNIKVYEEFLIRWHGLCAGLRERAAAREEDRKEIMMMLLKLFYQMPYKEDKDFYEQFAERCAYLCRKWNV